MLSIQNRAYNSGVRTYFIVVLTLEADDDDLYNYTILTQGILERI